MTGLAVLCWDRVNQPLLTHWAALPPSLPNRGDSKCPLKVRPQNATPRGQKKKRNSLSLVLAVFYFSKQHVFPLGIWIMWQHWGRILVGLKWIGIRNHFSPSCWRQEAQQSHILLLSFQGTLAFYCPASRPTMADRRKMGEQQPGEDQTPQNGLQAQPNRFNHFQNILFQTACDPF